MSNTLEKSNEVQSKKKVIIYELNEVPWEIVDFYVERKPKSHLASLIKKGNSLTTVDEDPSCSLQPWRTWPTFHTSLYADEHKSIDLGQDPKTFYGDNIWDVAEANGLGVGLFGVMQSWPARVPKNGGFYIPDTFSQTSEVYPVSLQRFQDFNLSMTKRDGFNPDSNLKVKDLFPLGLSLINQGLGIQSVLSICNSLIKERIEKKNKAGRSILQVLPCFDLYWKLHQQHKPDLSIFFTNHVAGMMHRFWGDAVPSYKEQYDYQPDEVHQTFIIKAMDYFDRQLGQIMKYVDQNPDSVVIVASSMGQHGIPQAKQMAECYVIENVDRLLDTLNLDQAEEGLAMHPRTALTFKDDNSLQNAIKTLESVVSDKGLHLFYDFSIYQKTLTFAVRPGSGKGSLSDVVSYVPSNGEKQTSNIEELGLRMRIRPGGGNTAYHIPQGIMISYGAGVTPNQTRTEINILDAAPSILNMLGLDKSDKMKGKSAANLILEESKDKVYANAK